MKCPECGKKITEKNWDAEYEWYECPKCEGCIEPAEVVREPSKAPKAKGKRRTEILDAEAEALAEYEKEQMVPTVRQTDATHHRDEVRTKEVVNIMADEIQAIYSDFGFTIDEENAQDKALILWRDAKLYARAGARDNEVEHALCGEHGG